MDKETTLTIDQAYKKAIEYLKNFPEFLFYSDLERDNDTIFEDYYEDDADFRIRSETREYVISMTVYTDGKTDIGCIVNTIESPSRSRDLEEAELTENGIEHVIDDARYYEYCATHGVIYQ